MRKFLKFDCLLLAAVILFCAACGGLFLHQTLRTGQYRVVTAAVLPESGGAPQESDDPAPGIMEGEHINLNTAGAADLMRLPGIGEKKAEAIIAYREEHGGFHTVEELTGVDGIGEKTLEHLRDYITVGE